MDKIRNLNQTVLSDGWRRLTSVSYEQLDAGGHWQPQKREVYHSGKAVAVLPFDEMRKTVLLVKQFRVPAYLEIGASGLLEACAGLVDEGETAEEAVIREAQEELGYNIDALSNIFQGFTSPGYSTEQLLLYLARYRPEYHKGPGGGLPQEGEDIEIIELPIGNALKLLDDHQIHDMKTAFLLAALRLRLSE
ncbi:NUDIX domain-containing protein [Bartonella sp. LJL80]